MKARHARNHEIRHRLQPALWRAHGDETAGELRARLLRQPARAAGDPPDVVCVLDADERLIGTIELAQLLVLPETRPLAAAARRDLPPVRPDAEQQHVASLALHHKLTAIPVTDEHGRLLGVVGATALLQILRREHVEDLHHLAGIGHETEQARSALEAPPLRGARHRLPWLLVGLIGSVVATFVVARFESALASKPALAFFVPGLVYLADAIGTQSETVAVRGLSISRVGLARLLGNELRTGLLIGFVLACAAFPLIWLAFGELRLAAAVAVALGGASVVAAMLGLMLPWLLGRLGTDPAYGSGPLATIVQDVLSLLIYFGSVTLIVL
jgi:magnesium transporter